MAFAQQKTKVKKASGPGKTGAFRAFGGIVRKAAAMLFQSAGGIVAQAKSLKEDSEHFSHKLPMIIGMMLIPTAVFVLYVGAFYQPTDNAKDTSVLLVNLDTGSLGVQTQNAIMESGVFKFRTTTYEYAQQSISEGSEWAAIVIPPDYSEKLENGQKTELWLIVDDQQSYIITRVLYPTFSVVANKVNEQVQASYLEQMGSGLGSAATQEELTQLQLVKVASASQQLAAGTGQAAAYTSTASQYSGEIGASAGQLASGMWDAGMAADSLRAGLITATTGANNLQANLYALENGTSQVMGAHQMLSGTLGTALQVAQTLPNSTSQATLIAVLTGAQAISTQEYAGIVKIDSGAQQLYAGSGQLAAGLQTATYGAATLEESLLYAYRGGKAEASAIYDASDSLNTLSEGEGAIASGQAQIATGAGLLAYKERKMATALSTASQAASSPPSVELVLKEAYKTNYGTFFATAFIVLGLFFGAASAYVYAALNMVKRALPFAALFCLAQVLVLLGAYLWMGFPAREGIEALFLVMAIISATFLMMTRAIAYLLGDIFTSEHLQIMSPVLSLLAVFMISSGGALWPQHTLNPPFSSFTPYIPFYYATMGVRTTALGASFPFYDMGMLLVFCAVFYVIRRYAEKYHRVKRERRERAASQ